MRVKNWDYRELRERIADGLTLRRFADFYSQHCASADQRRNPQDFRPMGTDVSSRTHRYGTRR